MPDAPFNLIDFTFSGGDDQLKIKDDVENSGLGIFLGAGVYLEDPVEVNTRAGNDRIEVALKFDGKKVDDAVADVTGFRLGPADLAKLTTGGGDDIVDAVVDGTLRDGATAGVRGISVDLAVATGTGKDKVTGEASVELGANAVATVYGIDGEGTIDTGGKNDTIKGIAEVTAGDVDNSPQSDLIVAGIANVTIVTGNGNDKVTGSATVDAGEKVW